MKPSGILHTPVSSHSSEVHAASNVIFGVFLFFFLVLFLILTSLWNSHYCYNCSHFKDEETGVEKLSNMPQVTQPVRGRHLNLGAVVAGHTLWTTPVNHLQFWLGAQQASSLPAVRNRRQCTLVRTHQKTNRILRTVVGQPTRKCRWREQI